MLYYTISNRARGAIRGCLLPLHKSAIGGVDYFFKGGILHRGGSHLGETINEMRKLG